MKFDFSKYLTEENKKMLPAAGVVLVIVLIGAYFLFFNKPATPAPQANPQNAQEQVNRLIAEVNQIAGGQLPAETPTVATVTDITQLAGNSFFQNAKNGDVVLIYASSQQAILYDPVAKKILNAGPIDTGTPSAQPSGAKVVLRNGTTTVGLSNEVEATLKGKIPTLNVVGKENGPKTDYKTSKVVVINQIGTELAAAIAKELGVEVGKLASDEAAPKDADVLVILGESEDK